MNKKAKVTKNAKTAPKVTKANKVSSVPEIKHQADGKLDPEPAPAKKHYTSLAQFWGEERLTKYGTEDADVYQTRLHSMSQGELWTHATNLGEVPSDNRDRLIKRLMGRFYLHINSFNRPVNHIENSVPDHIKKILAEGKS
jgi:hypothetical protein